MKPKKSETEGDMTPMIDCVFLLIIFFVMNQFKTVEGHLDIFLPKDTGMSKPQEVTEEELKDIRIFALERGDMIEVKLDELPIGTFNKKKLLTLGLESRLGTGDRSAAADQLNTELKNIHTVYSTKLLSALMDVKNSGAELNLVINVDPEVPYVFAVEAMNACFAAGITEVKFSGQKDRLFDNNGGVIEPLTLEKLALE